MGILELIVTLIVFVVMSVFMLVMTFGPFVAIGFAIYFVLKHLRKSTPAAPPLRKPTPAPPPALRNCGHCGSRVPRGRDCPNCGAPELARDALPH